MENKINLEKIILDAYGCKDLNEFNRCYTISIQMITEIMLEFGNQLLELAAKNANIKIGSRLGWEELKYKFVKSNEFTGYNDSYSKVTIDKQSITNTINQITI